MKIIFTSLLENALQYRDPARKLKVCVRSEIVESGVVYSVRDNGIGIREKHIASVFGIFKRLHGRDKFGGGTGAGLTIVKKIVEEHGGTVSLDSEPDRGTKATVVIPLKTQ